MKFIIVLVVVFAIALAEVEILQRDIDVQPDGFKFNSATSDGSQHNAEGQLLNIGSENEEISVHGSYSYIGDDGITYTVNYIADKNGFQPQGAHIPVVAGA